MIAKRRSTSTAVLRAYAKETALSEKFEAMVTLGERNTRMKDYFDVWLISRRFDFQGAPLSDVLAGNWAIGEWRWNGLAGP